MTEEHARSHLQLGSLNERASASTLMQRSNGSSASGAGDGAAARRLFVMGVLGAVALLVVVVGLVSVFASGALPWLVGTIVVVATVGVVVLGLHAGGHGWFVPLPVLVLAGAWALTGSAGNWTSGVAWTLAALAFISAASGRRLDHPGYRLPPRSGNGDRGRVAHGGRRHDAEPIGPYRHRTGQQRDLDSRIPKRPTTGGRAYPRRAGGRRAAARLVRGRKRPGARRPGLYKPRKGGTVTAAILVIVAVVLVGLIVLAAVSIKIVREYQRVVLFRLGRASGARGPG